MRKLSLGLLALLISAGAECQRTVEYHLNITDTTVNYTGRYRHAIAVNGQLPGPTLQFTEGDTAVIYIHNMMMMPTSIHWHGLIVPNRYDGVSYLTSAPIGPMQIYVARFPIVQSGTYWYHSHTMLQEQVGLYGAIVIHPRGWRRAAVEGGVENMQGVAGRQPMKEYTVLLSDWTDERPEEVQRSLHYATDWYAIRKGSTQDYWQAIRQGYLRTKLANEWKRMLPMDVSDVAYDRFLVNGHGEDSLPAVHPGDTVQLRIINGSSSTYFWLRFAGGKMRVAASDGKDVEPVAVDRMIIGVSETYDVLVKVPDSGSYELQATAEDRTGYVSAWLGNGKRYALQPLAPLNYFEGMRMMNGMKDMEMAMSNQKMDMNSVMYPGMGGVMLNYGMLRSPVSTRLPDSPVQELHFNLTGNMNR